MKLHVNVKAATDGFFQIFEKNLLQASVALEEDIIRNTPNQVGDLSEKKLSPEVHAILSKMQKGYLIKVKGNMTFIVSNYGTGSLMSRDNPGLDEYMKSNLWNKHRDGYNISGREEGNYTDIFGKQHHTTGVYRGKNIEGQYVTSSKNGRKYKIKPIKPSDSLNTAIHWFYRDWIPTCYKNTLNQFNLSKYITYK